MSSTLPQNFFKYLLWCLLLCFFSAHAQEGTIDTLALVKKYQQQASEEMDVYNFDGAIVNLSKANKLVTNTSDSLLIGDVKLNIAELHYFLQNYPKASVEAKHAVAFLKSSPDQQKIAKAYTLYAFILTRTKDFPASEKYFKLADKIYTSLDDEKNRSDVMLGLAILQLEKGKPNAAINYVDAVLPLFKLNNFKYRESVAYLTKAEAFLALEDVSSEANIEEAKNALNNTLKIINGTRFTRLKTDSYRIRAKIAAAENNNEEAYRLLQLYNRKNDSIYSANLNTISSDVDRENFEDLIDVIAQQKSNLDKQQRSINFTKMTTGLSIALIVILSLLTLSLYKNNNLRAKANELLQDKNNELLLAKEKAEKASLAKAQFLSTITHELRTPLYAVTGLTHLLLEENPLPEQKEHLNSLKFSGEYLLSLINNILDLNKLEANKVEIEKTSFNLKKRINDVLIALKKSADDRKNTLVLQYDDNIPNRLAGDPLKLSQILINLIGNSVKFTQNGEVAVRISLLDKKNNKAILLFEIEDNGVGISKKKQKSIFETFSQGSLQINRKFGGTGLGLSIVKNLLELMNSKIVLESQLGKGSKFSFKISFDVSEENQATNNSPKKITSDIDYAFLENKQVLVVEDNKINQMITKKILEKNKMVCKVADNGMDAVKLVQQNNFDIVLMDIHMPGISGIEATQKIREFNAELPIIALTAVTIDENLDDFYRAGFNEIIPKPFKTEEFFEKIHRTLDSRKISVDD